MHTKRNKGFTLVELLVVIAIIGLLSTIGVVSLNSARAKARDAKRISDVRQLASVMELYYNGKMQYPNSAAAGTKMDGGSVCETSGVAASGVACTGAELLKTIATAPTPPTGQYTYRGYTTTAPSTASGSLCNAALICQSYGIEFTLETSISGISSGANCLTQAGITAGACATPT